jgi:hypothetical protein
VVDVPDAAVPMNLWWMVPQYVLLGAADVFTLVGNLVCRSSSTIRCPESSRASGSRST